MLNRASNIFYIRDTSSQKKKNTNDLRDVAAVNAANVTHKNVAFITHTHG